PDYEVAGLTPGQRANELWLRRELDQIADERTSLLQRQAKYVRSMRCDVQRLASRAGMNLDQLVMRRGVCDPFLFRRLRVTGQHSRMPEPVLGREVLDPLLHRGRQRVICRTHVRKLRVAARGGYFVRQQERVGGAMRIEGRVRMPERVALVVQASPLVHEDVA